MKGGLTLPVSNGSGVAALTDDCGVGHAQIFKLAVSADGDTTLIPAAAPPDDDIYPWTGAGFYPALALAITSAFVALQAKG